MSERIQFAGLTLTDGNYTPIEFILVGSLGVEIDDKGNAGDVSLNISGREFEIAVDLKLPEARTIAAAILALADYVEKADARAGVKT